MKQCCLVFVMQLPCLETGYFICCPWFYKCHKLWRRAIVQTTDCTYDDLTLTNIQISTVVSWIRLMGLIKTDQFPLVDTSLARKELSYIIHRIIKEYTGIYVYHCLPLLGNCTFIQFGEFNIPQVSP